MRFVGIIRRARVAYILTEPRGDCAAKNGRSGCSVVWDEARELSARKRATLCNWMVEERTQPSDAS